MISNTERQCLDPPWAGPCNDGSTLDPQLPMSTEFTPGAIIRYPARPDWGLGQVQSAIGTRVTVNFEHAGKQLIDVSVVRLEVLSEDVT